jgi:putative membrane protein
MLAFAFALLVPFAAQGATLTDPEIVHVLHTANTGEITTGKLAEDKASSKEVQAFAVQMVEDHGAMDKEGAVLAERLDLTPLDNSVSHELKQASDKTLTDLKAAKADAFDVAYMDAMVKDHQTVLAKIDELLLPSAKSAELKKLI